MSGSGYPYRFTQQRKRGWRKPGNGFCCGRGSAFGNPFKGEIFGRTQAVALHRAWLSGEPIPPDVIARACLTSDALSTKRAVMLRRLPELRGRDLGCYCPQPAPGEHDLCHATALIELANTPDGGMP